MNFNRESLHTEWHATIAEVPRIVEANRDADGANGGMMFFGRLLPWSVFLALAIVLLSGCLCFLRESGTGGPHHDEVIALVAAKGLEREWVRMQDGKESSQHDIVPAAKWHRFTRRFTPVPFSEIRADVLTYDLHPPLAFWVMDRWLSLFPNSGYPHAVVLVWLQLLTAAVLLGITAFRCSGNSSCGFIATMVFLAGNSAIFTAIWVRQYGLFIVCFSVLVMAAAEITRKGVTGRQFAAWAAVIGVTTLFGMMSQYTFSTMTGPIHLAILAVLMFRTQWSRVAAMLVTYMIAGAFFFLLLPGVAQHASTVSHGIARKWQLLAALSGLPRMYIPVPSTVPMIAMVIAGTASLIGPLLLGILVVAHCSRQTTSADRADVRVPLTGMLGAGVLQFVMVTLGFFPGWATGENHMCAFWLLTVLAGSVLLADWSPKRQVAVVVPAIVMMIGMQSLFIWHMHRILPRINTSYIASEHADLVCVDNLARGFVLLVTDLMPEDSSVLATESNVLAKKLADGQLPDRILYLPMDNTVSQGKPLVIAAARQGGYEVKELPVVHTGMYEAILLSRKRW